MVDMPETPTNQTKLNHKIFHCNEGVIRIPQCSSTAGTSPSDSLGGARGVMVIVVGNGHGDTSSNPGRDWLHFSLH